MKFRIILWCVIVFAAAFLLFGIQSILMQRAIAEKTIRLHVVANSDSAEDQEHKLVVRDAVLKKVSVLTANCENASQAKQILAQNLDVIAQAAEAVSEYEISVTLGQELFDTRHYETFTLPAGRYPALRVNIGAAQGKNWWCVVFPSLCSAATTQAVESCAEVGGFDESERELITGGEKKYTFRFFSLQWLKKLFD